MLAVAVKRGYLRGRPRPCFSGVIAGVIAGVITGDNNTVTCGWVCVSLSS
jgi:hypothetical protein